MHEMENWIATDISVRCTFACLRSATMNIEFTNIAVLCTAHAEVQSTAILVIKIASIPRVLPHVHVSGDFVDGDRLGVIRWVPLDGTSADALVVGRFLISDLPAANVEPPMPLGEKLGPALVFERVVFKDGIRRFRLIGETFLVHS